MSIDLKDQLENHNTNNKDVNILTARKRLLSHMNDKNDKNNTHNESM